MLLDIYGSLTNSVEVRRVGARLTAHGTRFFVVKVHANTVNRVPHSRIVKPKTL
jgi:hypothetical protein